jgi:hypothetical protein
MKKTTKLRIQGLFLWRVNVAYWSVAGGSRTYQRLWITTTRRASIPDALAKAERFLKAHSDEYPFPQIIGVKARGSLDA